LKGSEKMNIEDFYKQKENMKISNEISRESAYNKDIKAYSDLAYANGFVACMKFMTKDNRIMAIESVKEVHDKDKYGKILEYILRLYNDEFKAIEFE
jgi:hypothetical protein